ncbi:MAG TPA: hypothetical protein VKW04_21900 [Planctomycetota bacterium]|nr:hypothetical protein [Planctomycetota bacterium]
MAEAIPRRRIPFWKGAGLLLGALVLGWGIAALAIHFVAERRWAAMKAEWQALLEEVRSRGQARAPLHGDPIDGNAWDDYAVALAEVRSLYDLESQAAPRYLKEAPQSNRKLVERVLARHPSMIESVRRAALRRQANLSLDWKEGALTLPSRHGSATVAPLAVCCSRFFAEEGRARDAAQLLLETCRFSADVDHVENLELPLEELREMLRTGALKGEDLSQLDRELELLDQEYPRRGHRAALELVALGAQFLKTGHSITVQLVGLRADPEEALWRYGFSAHLMKAEAFATIAAAVKQLKEADERPWRESRDLLRKLSAELAAHPNPIIQTAPEEVLASDLLHRGHRAQLRLLRLAAHFKATGEVLDLDDPFGGKLVRHLADDTLKVWSVGPEGTDHGGIGSYHFDPEVKDIVLEVRR